MKRLPAFFSGANALRSSEERFRLLVDGVRDYAILMLDPDGHVVSWNAGAERIKGYSIDEILGEHFSRFYPLEAIAAGWPQHELSVARREGRFEDEGWRIRKDGSRYWAHVVITALADPDGAVTGFSKIVRDTTERRKQDEALRQSEERFRLMVEGVRDYAIFMLDPDGYVVSWNIGANRIKGYSAAEIIGQHFSKFYPEEALARSWPEHELSVARREGRFEEEGWRVRKDGSLFWANVVITALHDTSGELRGYAKVTRDLTDRRKVDALEEEGRRINEFLAMLGHELRNPLAPIRNAVTLLGSRPSAEPSMARIHRILERQVEHLGRIVDDLLDLGRISTGNIEVRLEPLDFAALVTRSAEEMHPAFHGKQQTLEVHAPPAPLSVLGDPTRLSQVVLNLLGNAHKYTPSGGRVRVDVESDGRFAQLRVRDDGVGIPTHLLPRVFDAFVQGDRSLDRSEGGLGIGLTLVRKLVELHHGSVSASSRGEGQGSELVVRLPMREVETAQATEVAPGGDAVGSDSSAASPVAAPTGPRVLVVDDNEDAAETLAMLLEHWGHEVRIAADGPAALVAAAAFVPDVILLDIGLPGLDGYAVAERLRGTRSLLVALTGYGQPDDIARSERAGFAHHMVKPVDPVRLQEILATVQRSMP